MDLPIEAILAKFKQEIAELILAKILLATQVEAQQMLIEKQAQELLDIKHLLDDQVERKEPDGTEGLQEISQVDSTRGHRKAS